MPDFGGAFLFLARFGIVSALLTFGLIVALALAPIIGIHWWVWLFPAGAFLIGCIFAVRLS